MHIADTNDIRALPNLINSTNGDWGYVTVVIPDNDMNSNKWQELFNAMRRIHIIPIIRIATHAVDDYWVRPQEVDIDKWVEFLGNMNWPIQNRYVILFNEPNHAKEWGNGVDPEGYSDMILQFAKKLKTKSEDFFIMPAGFDASAPNGAITMDAAEFIRRMIQKNPDIFTYLDGWSSHAYPNPGFSGSPYASGRGSVATYLWEESLIQSLGVNKKLPIFITETGWQHSMGKYIDFRMLDPETIASYISVVSQNAWNNPNIVAITPFVFNYQDYPFEHFSWKKLGSEEYYPFYHVYKNIQKIKGTPLQIEKITVETSEIPSTLISSSMYDFTVSIKNSGQSILSTEEGYVWNEDTQNQFKIIAGPIPKLEPNERGDIRITIQTPKNEGDYPFNLSLKRNNQIISILSQSIRVEPPPSATITLKLGWRKLISMNDEQATVLVYDMNDTVLHKFTHVPINDGTAQITGLYHIIPKNKYRIVILVPYYLPRQHITTLDKGINEISMTRLLPLDFNNDGTLSLWDIFHALQYQPRFIFQKWF